MVDNTLSLEVELARRMLSKDEKELWNFLAAQLQLHFGHFIEKLPTIDNVVTSVQQYER